MGIMDKLFGDLNKKELKKIDKIVDRIEALEPEISKLSDEQLREKTAEFKRRFKEGETLDQLLPEAFAVCREGAWRSIGMKPFRVQLIGGVVLHQGRIAEMKTGEGKTLVATLPTYLNAIEGKGVHVVTVNDYLAKRDADWMGKVHRFLGLTVGCVIHGIEGEERKAAYRADVTYGTNNEFGFDYLRDNMVIYREQLTQRDLNYAIVDEVDSILIDEARTPLIISGRGDKSTDLYVRADRFAKGLVQDEDFEIEEKEKRIGLTEEGIAKAEEFFGLENYGDPENMEINHHVQQALRARFMMVRDVDYVKKDGEIVIVDEFTGRLMFGRRYSNGLHQAIEAKENVKVRSESKTLATITLQNYFRMYHKLAGMTGTAKTEEDEFREIYNMDVITIPTNKPVIREDLQDAVYQTENAKFNAIADRVSELHESGQPVLVGTISIEKSELISDLLRKRGVKHNVLNAKHHEREAEIVAQAGRLGAVTIATNMAGRGTDIILGGNAEFEARKELRKQGFTTSQIDFATGNEKSVDFDDLQLELAEEMAGMDEGAEKAALQAVLTQARAYNEARAKAAEEGTDIAEADLPEMPKELDPNEFLRAREMYREYLAGTKETQKKEHDKVVSLGGLSIIGSERHESRRIDNQLRGRAGRQGDPGQTQFFISLEDDLMRLFGGERMQGFVARMGLDEGEAIQAGMLSRSIESAQKKVEGRNFGIRKYVLQYDNVMNKQREIIYGERRKVLFGEDLKDYIMGMTRSIIDGAVEPVTMESKFPEDWDFDAINRELRKITPLFKGKSEYTVDELAAMDEESLKESLYDQFEDIYTEKEKVIGAERMRVVERRILLRVVDSLWMDQIDAMDQLKEGIGLRSIGQQDPVAAYAKEGYDMFDAMINQIREETVMYCYGMTLKTDTERRAVIEIGESKKAEFVDEEARQAAARARAESGQRGGAQGGRGGMPKGAPAPDRQARKVPVKRETPKLGRNAPCHCGSGKKYKNCCMQKDLAKANGVDLGE